MAKEQEKKIEERKKNLIGEWDDEEDGENFFLILSNLVIRNFLVTAKLFLKVKCSLLPIFHY